MGELAVARVESTPDSGSSRSFPIGYPGSYIVWEECTSSGSHGGTLVPGARYGHTLTSLSHNGLIVMYGGKNDEVDTVSWGGVRDSCVCM